MLTIKANKLSLIKKEFNSAFPYLKLEFFKERHDLNKGNHRNQLIKEDLLLKPLKTNTSNIEVDENMPVSTLEELFNQLYGVSVQVFRKSGKIWLETTVTDDWTLKKQNEEGKELST